MRPAAVVFDMDGLLLDSERLALLAFEEACSTVGVVVSQALYHRCIGSSWETTRALLTEALDSPARYDALDRAWRERYQLRLDAGELELKPGARELLEALAEDAVPCALATSTLRPLATRKLAATGVLHHFRCLVCGGETRRGKPHPDPYLAAVSRLDVPASLTWALEDSENGVRAAHAAGLRVFQVPDLVAPTAALTALGHTVVDDLHAVLRLLR